MNVNNSDLVPQGLRDKFAAAIQDDDAVEVEKLLKQEPLLANTDLRKIDERNVFSFGHPLYLACEKNKEQLATILLTHGSHPDAPGPNPDDRPVHGMPLHLAASDHHNYRLANLLLDHGATPNSYPNCDKATIEVMFYQAREIGVSDAVVRRAYTKFLPDQTERETQTATDLIAADAEQPLKLFARMIDLGAQPPFAALVREGYDDLLMEIVEHCSEQDGTPHDHPNARVIDNIAGAARWYGYPRLVRRLIEHESFRYEYESALGTISVAIGSHNRDGGYPEYREIIVMQLELLKKHGDLERARKKPDYNPLHTIATDFIWHDNYGYRAEIAKPESYIDLAELFVSWGFDDINFQYPEDNHSPLSSAVKRGHHPGIATYIQWLVEKGAELRESAPDEVNPKAIAREKGFDEILRILEG